MNEATHSLWNGLTSRPDGGWATNVCTAHLEAIRRDLPRLLEGCEIRPSPQGDAPCYVCERQRLDPWAG
jgi:hypothetical protein